MTLADKVSLAIVIVLGIGITLATTYLSYQAEQQGRLHELENRAYIYMSHIRKSLLTNMNSLLSVRGVFNAVPNVSHDEFRIFTEPALISHPEIQFLAWAPRVTREARSAHEHRAAETGLQNYAIMELDGPWQLRTARQRDQYFPVFYLNPLASSREYLGYDFSTDTMFKRHMRKALESGKAVATAPIGLNLLVEHEPGEVASSQDEPGLLVFLAVYHSPHVAQSQQQQEDQLKGYVVALYKLNELFSTAVADLDTQGLSVQVDDISLTDLPREVYSVHSDKQHRNIAGKYRGEVERKNTYQEVLTLAGRDWRFKMRFTDQANRASQWVPNLVFAGGVLFTGFLAAYVIGNSKRRSIIEDMIEERTAELREISERVQKVLDNTGEGICGIDVHGNTTFVNQAALSITGFEEKDFLYRNQHSLIHHHYPDGRIYPDHECKIYKAFTEGVTTRSDDEVFWHKDGYAIPVEYTATPMRDDEGKILGAVVVFHDIRQRKQYEDELIEARNYAETASRAKTTFLATMSHEIRTPMNGMLGMAQLLEQTSLNEKQATYVKTLIHSGKALLEQINDILDFSRIEAGKLHLENTPLNLKQTCQDLMHLLENGAEAKGLYLRLNYADDCPTLFIGDKLRIRQILLNLVGNAIKFTSSGGVELNISCHGVKASQVRLQFEVKDTGIGIEADKLKHLFDSFTQVDASTTRKYGGSGLGLAISRQLAELMDGDISVSSELGKGSSFVLRLALHETMELAMELPENLEQLCFEGRVLLVEDNFVNQQVANAMLTQLGLDVELAENGEEALKKFQQNDFDLILMDCQMPIMDGYTATQKIRQQEHGERVPILALTANVLPEDVQRCIEAGMNACVHKPIEVDVLQSRLKEWLPYDVAGPQQQEEPGEKPMSASDDVSHYVNLDTLSNLASLMGEVFDQLIPSYIEASDKCFNDVRDLVQQQDFETAERLFHSLKSSSRNLGAMKLGDYAERLEAVMRDKQVEQLEPGFTEASDMYQQVRAILLDFQANR